jgi:hypothetical protein
MFGWKQSLICLGALSVMAACSDSKPMPNIASPQAEVAEAPATWRPFADTSPWNTPVPADAAIDPDSKALMEEFATHGGLYINITAWSVPVYYVDIDETPRHDVYDLYPGRIGRGFEHPRSIPIPNGATLSPPARGTGYIAIVDKQRSLEWDMKQAFQKDDGQWYAGFGAVTNLRGTGVSKPWNEAEEPLHAATALPSGFPLTAGLVRLDEIAAGRISHALMIGTPEIRTDVFIPPASTGLASNGTLQLRNNGGLPMGAHIQLDPSLNLDKLELSPAGKTIARALQEYGAFVGENAGANTLFAEGSPEQVAAWDGVLAQNELQAVFPPEMMSKHFRLIEMGDLLPGQPAD